jgi:hypothetical protein
MMNKSKLLVLSGIVLLGAWSWMIPMGEGEDKASLREPSFTPLEEGQEDIEGIIKDENTATHVKHLSFFGHTTVGGIRQETNDAVTKFDLAKIKSITVTQHTYQSKRYPEKDFCLVDKISLEGAVSKDMLVPRHVVVCGIEKGTGDQKAWYLNKLNEVIIEKVGDQSVSDQDKKKLDETLNGGSVKESAERIAPMEKKTEKIAAAGASAVVGKTTEQYKEKEIQVIEKKTTTATDLGIVKQAISDWIEAFVGVLKAVYKFVKNLIS